MDIFVWVFTRELAYAQKLQMLYLYHFRPEERRDNVKMVTWQQKLRSFRFESGMLY